MILSSDWVEWLVAEIKVRSIHVVVVVVIWLMERSISIDEAVFVVVVMV